MPAGGITVCRSPWTARVYASAFPLPGRNRHTRTMARTDPSRAQQDTAKLVTEHHQLGSSTEADTDEASQAGPDPGPRAHAASHTDTDIFLALQAKLNFKYPRACKTLLLLWCMAHLRHSSKDSLPIHAVYERYCQDVTTKQRVPQADFAPELVKALALLTISPHKVQANDQQIFKGIAWRGDMHQRAKETSASYEPSPAEEVRSFQGTAAAQAALKKKTRSKASTARRSD